jgi:hypothetical protein
MAARVVTLIGPKRNRLAWPIASSRGEALSALGVECEVDHRDGVRLHDADEQEDPDRGHDGEVHTDGEQGSQGAHPGGG